MQLDAPSVSETSWLHPSEWDILVLSTVIKVLLFPAYRSTDFEVHRNWLAITHSLPISQWYYDTSSQWTLDYPPFFAYFEKILSIPASVIDPKIVDLNNLNYDSWSIILYQRTTVIITELVLGAALLKFIRGAVDPPTQRVISASLFLHPGFLIIDHIHFQYNGFMFGILLWSILMARNGNKLASGILFAVLLNFKHIYMYLAPAYFIYLLRSFCLSPSGQVEIKNFLALANAVIAIFIASLAPFALMGQIHQLMSRLFPFTRGLNHAYWAPNAWALITAADRVLLRYAKSTGQIFHINMAGVSSTSRGLVGDTVFAVLPNIKPLHTFTITIALQSIVLIKLWFHPTYKSFLTALTLCGYSSYLFGWHVHEKAVLLILVPLSLLAAERHAYFRTFVIATVAGVFSLFPLLFTPAESVIEVIYSIVWFALLYIPLSKRVYEFPKSLSYVILDVLEKLYLGGFIFLQIFVASFPVLASWNLRRKIEESGNLNTSDSSAMEFLPLMVTSVYCAIGMVWGFMRLIFIYLNEDTTYQGQLSTIQ
ncbi:MAG: glycosyltransferase family 57 protein [Lentinula lateritia]|uniref:Alpha-1,3-glucosyltransferase n=1 Tax=Lentinula lateritia TaxID=40482 RepID=A0ABQ8V9K6_9AGAR|nr:MAG: glycosyltransferase family 57 protein [Lentinula lateritia]KAJ4482661.1 glycosyltransferase family 57 protein [Lentinula lateritia]